MAGGESNKNTSQFYITFSKTKSLNKKHVVFGQIIYGFGILRELEHVETREYDNKVRFNNSNTIIINKLYFKI